MSLVFNVSVAFFNKYTTDVLDENTGMPQSLFRLGTDRGVFFSPPLSHASTSPLSDLPPALSF